MDYFWKSFAVMLLTVIFAAAIEKTEKDLSVLLTLAGCCMMILGALRYFAGVVAFLWDLYRNIDTNVPFMEPLVKISGIALIMEVTCLISSDCGNTSLSKAMQILGNAVILSLSLPLFETFFTIIQEILGVL